MPLNIRQRLGQARMENLTPLREASLPAYRETACQANFEKTLRGVVHREGARWIISKIRLADGQKRVATWNED